MQQSIRWYVAALLSLLAVHHAGAQNPSTAPATTRAAADGSATAGLVYRLGATRFAMGNVGAISFSADGKRLAVVDAARRVTIWDADTGLKLLTLSRADEMDFVSDVCFIGNRRVAVVLSPGTILIYDSTTGRITCTCKTVISRMIIGSPTGDRFLVLDDTMNQLFDPADGRQIAKLGDGRAYANASTGPGAAFTADGKTVMTVTSEGEVRLWNAVDGSPQPMPTLPRCEGVSASITPDGKTIAMYAGALRLFDRETGRELPAPRADPLTPRRFSFAPTGTILGGWSMSQFRRWDVTNPERQLPAIEGLPLQDADFRWSGDGRKIAYRGRNGAFAVVDLATGRPVRPDGPGAVGHACPVVACLVSADDGDLVTADADGAMIRWNLATGALVTRAEHAGLLSLTTILSSRDGELIGANQNQIQLYDAETLQTLRSVRVASLLLSPDARLTVRQTGEKSLDVTEWETGTRKLSFQGELRPQYVSFSPDSKILAISQQDRIELRELASGEALQPVKRAATRFMTSAFSPDGASILCATNAGVGLFDLRTGGLRWLSQSTRLIDRLAFSPTGMPLVLKHRGGALLLDPLNGQPFLTVEQESGDAISCVSFTSDGSRLICGMDDTSVRIWSIPGLLADPPSQAKESERLWDDLGAEDSATAYRAGAALLKRPDELTRLASSRLVFSQQALAMRRRVEELSSSDQEARERAHRELERGGAAAEEAVTEALRNPPAGEPGERLRAINRLLAPADQTIRRQRARAVQILQWLPETQSKPVLAQLADSGLTDAKEAIKRIEQRRVAATRPAPATAATRPN